MAYIRVFNQSLRLPPLLLVLSECLLLLISAFAGIWLRFGAEVESLDQIDNVTLKALAFALVLSLCTHAMRVYEAGLREGFVGVLLRSIVAYTLLGCSVLTVLYYIMPTLYLGRGVLALSVMIALLLVSLFRFVYFVGMGDARLKRNVLVLGAGYRARKIEQHIFNPSFHGNIVIVGFIPSPHDEEHVSSERLIEYQGSLMDMVSRFDVDEIVVALDERRQRDGVKQFFPSNELLECKMSGISILEVMTFFEREMECIELGELRPSWMIYSEGFNFSIVRNILKRIFDIGAALLVLFFTWPLILFAALAIKIEDGWSAPVLFRQARVGEGGKEFELLKLRSMSVDAEADGKPQWAKVNDSRITRVGRFIRDVRVDELPQIYNVLRGEMSFVGPRPERPQFVATFNEKIPYYDARHRIKPGLMGWAQLCYPYGASAEDAAQKLRYDLYYIKHHSLLFDLRIMLQTVEVVLIGNGVR
jgi:sugar transferase (PEP-CTERM system associated)